jgi:drug/metabolite transporter (DMT)-like permease
MNRPLLLLLGTGAALGLNFPLGKLAMAAGITPALWAAVISLGAGLAMLFIVTVTEWKNPSRTSTTYFAIVSGFLSYVMPNALTYAVIPKIGSGLAAIMFALSPVVTALLSVIFRVRPPNLISILGIVLGLAGAGIIIFSRNTDFSGGAAPWILLALLIPLFLRMLLSLIMILMGTLMSISSTPNWPAGIVQDLMAVRMMTGGLFRINYIAMKAIQSGGILYLPMYLKRPV